MKLVKNFSFLFGENFLKLLLGAFTSIFVARKLSPEGYGNLSYILSFSALFLPFFTMGSDDWFLGKFSSSKDQKTDQIILTESLLVRKVGSLLGLVLTLIGVYFFGKTRELSTFIVLLNIFFSLKVFDSFSIFLTSKEKIDRQAKARTLTYFITNTLKILIALFQPDYSLIVFISCFELILFGVGYFISYKKEGYKYEKADFAKGDLNRILSFCLPLMALSFVNIGFTKIDQVMLGNLVGSIELGKYSVVVKLIELWQFLPIILTTTFLPRIMDSTKNTKEYGDLKGILLGIILSGSILFSIATFVISKPLILLLFGSKYTESIPILRLYLWQSILFFTFISKQKFLMAESRIKLSLSFATIAFLSNLSLNLYFIPQYKSFGAIIASIGSVAISEVLLTIFSPSFRQDNWAIIKSLNFKKSSEKFRELIKDD